MKARPILFSGAMVRALLEGRKTQTRRLLKNPEYYGCPTGDCPHDHQRECNEAMQENLVECPYGKPGDLLWVRESYQLDGNIDHLPPSECEGSVVWWLNGCSTEKHMSCPGRIRNHRFMPRWASRITLELTGVRVERLQDISEDDARLEGVEPLEIEREDRDYKICPKCGGTRLHNGLGGSGGVIFDIDCTDCDTHKKRFNHLWQSINGAGNWEENPWVWVLEFKVSKMNIVRYLEGKAA